ncbi:hypothetical protein PENTCL1PPCAC_1223, partial [Pristionchus entomophagus]
LLSSLLILITTILTIIEIFVFSDCSTPPAVIVKSIGLICSVIGTVAFFLAIRDRSETMMRVVLFVSFYRTLQSMIVLVLALLTCFGSESSSQDEVSGKFSFLVGVYAAILSLFYAISCVIHCILFKSFREQRLVSVEGQRGVHRDQHPVYSINPPEYKVTVDGIAPPSYETFENESDAGTVKPPPYQTC